MRKKPDIEQLIEKVTDKEWTMDVLTCTSPCPQTGNSKIQETSETSWLLLQYTPF